MTSTSTRNGVPPDPAPNPENPDAGPPAEPLPVGPHPGIVSVPAQYVFEQNIRQMQKAAGSDPNREDNYRLQGVQMIDNVRRALQLYVSIRFLSHVLPVGGIPVASTGSLLVRTTLTRPSPVRTFDTAAVYFHRFRLRHREAEYNLHDSAMAALFVACKVEDTIKKSKDILCAAYNLKNPDHPTTTDDKVSPPLHQPYSYAQLLTPTLAPN